MRSYVYLFLSANLILLAACSQNGDQEQAPLIAVEVAQGTMVSEPEIYAMGMAVVADGTDRTKTRVERALTADTGLGVTRLADAGYELAIQTVRERNIKALVT